MERILGTVEEQIELEKMKEEEGVNKSVRDLQKAIERGEFSDTVYGKVLVKLGYSEYVSKLEEYCTLTYTTNVEQRKIQKLLLLINDDMKVVAFTVISECINAAVKNKALSSTAIDIVAKLRDLFLYQRLKSDNPKLHTYLGDKFRKAGRIKKRKLIKKHIDEMYTFGEYEGDKALMVRLGTTLINILELSGANIIRVAKERVDYKGKSVYKNTVCITEDANDILSNIEFGDFVMSTINKYPMIVPPKPWTTNRDGGFLKGKNKIYTTKSKDVSKHLSKHKLTKLYPIINKLQNTAWRVNTTMLSIVSEVFNSNMIDPKSPDKAPYLYGELPTRDPYKWEDFIKEENFDKWHDFNREREDITLRADAEQSKRLEVIYTLSVAEKMKEYQSIYFPYVFDYRGRVYSDVNFLTPQGQSYTKALLEFTEGRKLDDIGIFWLKVHTANCYGKDKEEYEERIEWFNTNEDTIINIGTDPMAYKADWVWSDSPFEYVAACIAWVEHKAGGEVHLPIQLDATCSGIQMYSGLLRDKLGGIAVNVIGNTRNDIYQLVADKVNGYLQDGHYSQWVEYKDREGVDKSTYTVPIAKSMIGNITRSIVKRNVMTVPYSVTRMGMSNQIRDKMDEAILKGTEFWEGDKWVANKILTQLNHEAIYDTIEGAKKGQDYLVSISSNLDRAATWHGVLYDFPIKQTALALKETRVKTIYGRLNINLEIPKLNKRRQNNSIAPNFIHNIDSTILLYCIENMSSQIGVIHDCFLVHPNDGQEIQDWYKEGFITVMKADPIRSIQQQLDPDNLIEFPEYGELDLNEVRDSKYIIS